MKTRQYNHNNEKYEFDVDNYEEELLLKDIEEVRKALSIAYTNFENVTEPDLIDSCIYELQAIQMKHQYLINLAKDRNIVADIR
ncbi:MAG: YaaL family protein [Eubacteriales bacterium]